MNTTTTLFHGRHFPADLITLCVCWYFRYSLSLRDLEEIMLWRGISVDHTTIHRWVQRYAADLEHGVRRKLRSCNDSWRVDETYIKIRGRWFYLYRAIDSSGATIDFHLSATRDQAAAKRFFRKALSRPHASSPRVVSTDKDRAYPPAFSSLQSEALFGPRCKLRQIKYLNNIIEQDHRRVKRRMKASLGFKSESGATAAIRGVEAIGMIKKGQVKGIGKDELGRQVEFMKNVFGLAA